jgi:hypothetical protein
LHHKPSDGSTHWSSRKLAAQLGISHMRGARAWAKAGLQPSRRRHYMASDDPAFESKAADIYRPVSQASGHAAVFCVDEKSAIQALGRLDQVLPLSPGRAERHGFEYFRHGTLSLYAALEVSSGQVLGKTTQRHTRAKFVAFLADVVATHPRASKSRSSPTTFRRTKLRPWQSSAPPIPTFSSITPRLTLPGSISSKSGSPKFSAI